MAFGHFGVRSLEVEGAFWSKLIIEGEVVSTLVRSGSVTKYWNRVVSKEGRHYCLSFWVSKLVCLHCSHLSYYSIINK